jgi:hypothetical protein
MEKTEKTIMLPALAAAVLIIFAGAILVAYLVGETTLLTTMLGSTIPMAQTVLGYYFGSSRGSQAKSDTIAANAAAANVNAAAANANAASANANAASVNTNP